MSAIERVAVLLEASPLGVERELSESNKTARSITLVGDLAPANASISICVSGLSEGPILGEWRDNEAGEVSVWRRGHEKRSGEGKNRKWVVQSCCV